MYRHCIYCSADLGANESIEAFPVGRSLAFDAAKGRLWAVCPKCTRWNLAPIEERWEAMEAAEKLFADSRLRAQSENVGLAKLRDGTRLIRVGEALVGELAAWRYGRELLRRRWKHAALTAAGFVGVTAAGLLAGVTMIWIPISAWKRELRQRVLYRVPVEGTEVALRLWHADGAVLRPAEGGEGIEVVIPEWRRVDPRTDWRGRRVYSNDMLVLGDARARAFLARAMVDVNEKGASRKLLDDAVQLLARWGSAEEFIRGVATKGRTLGQRHDLPGAQFAPRSALVLEMALHEEQERRALEGELALLESAWREAEEIASIADRLATAALPPSTDNV